MSDKIKMGKSAHALNDEIANKNRDIFKKAGLTVFNMISSPGSGKTSLMEVLGKRLGQKVFVITGDIQTQLDKERITKAGAQAVQIETHGSCHLTAQMIYSIVKDMSFDGVEFLIIENIGNLVCPSSYDLGEDEKMAVLSVAEGDEKPIKYPGLFIRANSVILNKIDLVPYVRFDMERAVTDIKMLKHDIRIFKTSCFTGEGLDEFIDYLKETKNKVMLNNK